MRRAAVLVVLVLLTFDVSGLCGLCDEPSCDEPCPTDVSGGQCPPNCHYCSCCSLPSATSPAVFTLVAPTAHARAWVGDLDSVPCPDSADILHVPKVLPA